LLNITASPAPLEPQRAPSARFGEGVSGSIQVFLRDLK
jgi:hypothetical protein